MSYQSRRMNSILTLSIIVFVNCHSTLALMCYVCGAGSQEPFMQSSKSKLEYSDMDIPLSCDEFESSNNLDKFIFKCPSDYVGCITQSDGTEVTRTCDSLPMNDCQTANGIEYCYCTEDLCNKKKVIPTRMHHDTFYDDEDASDGFESSGYGARDTISDGAAETTVTTTSSSSSSSSPTFPNIVTPSSDVTVTTRKVTTAATTTTEAITANKVFTVGSNQSHTITSSTTESINHTNASNFVECSKVFVIMQLLMLVYPLCC